MGGRVLRGLPRLQDPQENNGVGWRELADPLEEVFTAALESRIFRKRWVLLPDYVPEELPHREAELRRLAEVLAPALRGEKPSNALLYGLTGTGKTAVARLVLRRLEARASGLGVWLSLSTSMPGTGRRPTGWHQP